MKRLSLCILVLFSGCASTQLPDISTDQPELISTAPLPAITSAAPVLGLKLSVLLHVAENGTVTEVKLLSSGGTPEWDSLAVHSIMKWRFTEPRRDGVPVSLWIRKIVIVQIQERMVRNIGELVAATRREADSLYSLIENGAAFESLAGQVREGPSGKPGGYLGSVDLAVFPQHVREALQKLREDEVTHPLRIGDKYVIYKRLKKGAAPPLSRSGAGTCA